MSWLLNITPRRWERACGRRPKAELLTGIMQEWWIVCSALVQRFLPMHIRLEMLG